MITRIACAVRFLLVALLLGLVPLLLPRHIEAAAGLVYTGGGVIISGSGGEPPPNPSSTVNVPVAGTIRKVTVTVQDFTGADIGNVALLLTGPQGQNVMLLAGSGTQDIFSRHAQLTFDDAAAVPVLACDGYPYGLISGTYQPINCQQTRQFRYVPAGPPYGRSLSVFNGTDAAGVWTLTLGISRAYHGSLVDFRSWSISLTMAGDAQPLSATNPQAGDIRDDLRDDLLTITASGGDRTRLQREERSAGSA